MQGGQFTGGYASDWLKAVNREKQRKLELYNQLIEGNVNHKDLADAISEKRTKAYKPRGIEGVCSSCRGRALANNGRYFHPKGVCSDDVKCPVGSYAGERVQSEETINMGGGFMSWRVAMVDPDWATVEIEIPEYSFFSLELIGGE